MAISKQGRRAFDRDTIIQIRRAWRYGHSAAEIAHAWEISEKSARQIAKGRTYPRVVDDSPGTPSLPLPKRTAASERRRIIRGPKEAPGEPVDTRRVEGAKKAKPDTAQRRSGKAVRPAKGQ